MFSNRVREVREEKGLTQVELARICRIASTNLCAIERGKLWPWDRARKRIAKGLRTPEE